MPAPATNVQTTLTAPAAAAVPIIGIHAAVLIEPVGTDANGNPLPYVLLKNSKYSISPKAEIKSANNTTDGILRCAGLPDYEFTVNGSVDATSAATYVEGSIMPGSIVNFRFYRSHTKTIAAGQITAITGDCWQGTGIISDIKFETGVDEDPETWELSGMKQSGNLTLPGGGTF